MHYHIHPGKYFLTGFIVLLTVIFVDQYTKWLVMETVLRLQGPETASFWEWFTTQKKLSFFVDERERFKYLTLLPFLNFVMVWNQGISFGMFNTNSSGMALLLIGLSLFISSFLMIWLALCNRRVVAFALGLVIGGALANVMDRVRFDAVADFIDFHFMGYHWPAFNVADACIVIGAVILMACASLGTEVIFGEDR